MRKPAKPAKLPIALTIAGSDSGGGAGIQADLKAFAAAGVHGATAITCVTAQNPAGVLGIQAVEAKIVQAQLEAVFAELPPKAAKTGMLYSAEIIRVVAGHWIELGEKAPPLVVDPVMVATSGAKLLKDDAVAAMVEELCPLAALITPNVDEIGLFTGSKPANEEELRESARLMHRLFGRPILAKGGHLRGGKHAVDIFYDGKQEWLLVGDHVPGVSTHGTGCTFSAAITAYLALGSRMALAVELAKNHITQAIGQSAKAGRHWVLNNFWS